MHRLSVTLTLAVAVTCVVLASAQADTAPIVGRWNVTITVDGKPRPSWMEVREEDGKYRGLFCSEVGGVYDIGEVGVDGDRVTFHSVVVDVDGRPSYTYTGTLKGDAMSGTREWQDHKHEWTAKRSVPRIDVTGTWDLVIRRGETEQKQVLTLQQKGGEITGKLVARAELPLRDASLKDGVLSFVVGEENASRRYEAKVKGDVLEGSVRFQSRGRGTAERGERRGRAAADREESATEDAQATPQARQGRRGSAEFTGQRQRQWGEPIALFNGKDLEGWKPLGKEGDFRWTVEDGVMMTPGGANIVSERKFADFKLHVEFRVPKHGNSGVYLRGRYEIQIEDSFGQEPASGRCGGLYSRITPSTNASKPAGEWQTYDATLIGQYITVDHNGVRIIDNQEIEGITGGALDSNEHEPGPIYLQGDHGKIEYRKIIITPAAE